MEKAPVSFYKVRFNDCDPLGHLNNSRYLDYFLNAREDHLKDSYGIDLKEWVAQGKIFVVSSHEIRYVRPVTYNEVVGIQSALIGWGETWLQVEMLMYDSLKELKAVLWTIFTRINATTGRREVHPAEFVAFVREVLVDDVDPAKGLAARVGMLKG
jgi:YbgC/YbaW family acyl-CoA thioester hydrolase